MKLRLEPGGFNADGAGTAAGVEEEAIGSQAGDEGHGRSHWRMQGAGRCGALVAAPVKGHGGDAEADERFIFGEVDPPRYLRSGSVAVRLLLAVKLPSNRPTQCLLNLEAVVVPPAKEAGDRVEGVSGTDSAEVRKSGHGAGEVQRERLVGEQRQAGAGVVDVGDRAAADEDIVNGAQIEEGGIR